MASGGPQSSWLSTIKESWKTAMLQDGRVKVHYVLTDGREMAEEYDRKTEELLVRKWKMKSHLGEGKWEWEIGEEGHFAKRLQASATELLVESSSAPFIVRRDTPKAFEWRIRNLPYPVDVYSVTAEPEVYGLVLRTSNKKYYKRLEVTNLKRIGCPVSQSGVSFVHANNTLIITCRKPREMLETQRAIYREVAELLKGKKDGDVNCTQS